MKIAKTIPVPVGALWELLDAIKYNGGVRLREMLVTKDLAKSGLVVDGKPVTNPLVDLETAFETEAKKLGISERQHLFETVDRLFLVMPMSEVGKFGREWGYAFKQAYTTHAAAHGFARTATDEWKMPHAVVAFDPYSFELPKDLDTNQDAVIVLDQTVCFEDLDLTSIEVVS